MTIALFIPLILFSILLHPSVAVPVPSAGNANANAQSQSGTATGSDVPSHVTINLQPVTSRAYSALSWLGYTLSDSTDWWYDPLSGAFGPLSKPMQGFIQPGMPLGFAPANASAGDTGIYVNGRELPQEEVQALMYIGVTPQQGGRYWLVYTGAYGNEGSAVVLGNLWDNVVQALNGQMQGSGGGSGNGGGGGASSWSSGATGNYGGSDGNGFSYVGGEDSSGNPWSVSVGR